MSIRSDIIEDISKINFDNLDLKKFYFNISQVKFLTMPKMKPFEMISKNRAIMGYHLGRMKGAEHKIKRAIDGISLMI